MKALLGILLLINAALLMWNMGQREFSHGEYSPAADFHPELMNLLPAEKSRSMAKVTIGQSGAVTTSQPADNIPEATQEVSIPLDSIRSDIAKPITTEEAAATEMAAVAHIKVAEGQCMFIGPYTTVIDRDRAGRQLHDMKIDFSEREDTKGRRLGYRVYQGPFSTNEDVSRARRRLEKQGVKDLYLMNEGADRKYISLGFFSNEKSANEFMRQFSELKVKSKLRLEYATYYWISVSDFKAIAKLSEKDSMPMLPGIRKTARACSEIP